MLNIIEELPSFVHTELVSQRLWASSACQAVPASQHNCCYEIYRIPLAKYLMPMANTCSKLIRHVIPSGGTSIPAFRKY